MHHGCCMSYVGKRHSCPGQLVTHPASPGLCRQVSLVEFGTLKDSVSTVSLWLSASAASTWMRLALPANLGHIPINKAHVSVGLLDQNTSQHRPTRPTRGKVKDRTSLSNTVRDRRVSNIFQLQWAKNIQKRHHLWEFHRQTRLPLTLAARSSSPSGDQTTSRTGAWLVAPSRASQGIHNSSQFVASNVWNNAKQDLKQHENCMKQYETTVRLVKLGMAQPQNHSAPARSMMADGSPAKSWTLQPALGWHNMTLATSGTLSDQDDQEGRRRIRQFSSLHMSACSPSVASSCVSLQVS